MRYAFIFVCQQGELELKALLLAASLRRFLRVDHELIAALPQPETTWGQPSQATLALLECWGVRCVPIENPIGPEYPIGNKLACLGVATGADKLVFLDTDMLCMREFAHMPRFERAFNAKPADFATYAKQAEAWAPAYAAAALPMPATRMSATVSGELMLPYYNAGFVAVRANTDLDTEWPRIALLLEADAQITNKRPWLDQIALPLAVSKLALDVDCLDERFNFPAHVKPLDPDALPWFCHYHAADVLRREPLANALVMELVEAEPLLGERLRTAPAWAPLLKAYAAAAPTDGRMTASATPAAACRAAARGPDVIITGLPRSGTSWLCSLLNRQLDCVVINEPVGIFVPLATQSVPYGVPLLYADLRHRVRDGEPVENKLHNGEFIEDTAEVDKVESWLPAVTRADFLLATKNTLAYLARLPQLRRAMPAAAIVVCVRHPLDTIASWKTTFPHLVEANLEAQAVGHSRDALLSGAQRRRLEEIAATPSAALRRALLWRHLAKLVLENRSGAILLRYEELVTAPTQALQRIFASLGHAYRMESMAPIEASTPRSRREALDEEDVAAIRAVCAQTAANLGYDVI